MQVCIPYGYVSLLVLTNHSTGLNVEFIHLDLYDYQFLANSQSTGITQPTATIKSEAENHERH